MNAALRAQAILADPAAEWTRIEAEPGDAAALFIGYAALLALIPPIAGLIGACVVGVVVPGAGTVRAPILAGLFGAAFRYVMSFASVLGLALVINLLAPAFSSHRSFERAFKLAVYSYTPLWLAGIFLLAPGLYFLVLTGFYGVYLFWRGVPALMQTPKPQAKGYTAAVAACACALTLIIAGAQHALFGFAKF